MQIVLFFLGYSYYTSCIFYANETSFPFFLSRCGGDHLARFDLNRISHPARAALNIYL